MGKSKVPNGERMFQTIIVPDVKVKHSNFNFQYGRIVSNLKHVVYRASWPSSDSKLPDLFTSSWVVSRGSCLGGSLKTIDSIFMWIPKGPTPSNATFHRENQALLLRDDFDTFHNPWKWRRLFPAGRFPRHSAFPFINSHDQSRLLLKPRNMLKIGCWPPNLNILWSFDGRTVFCCAVWELEPGPLQNGAPRGSGKWGEKGTL